MNVFDTHARIIANYPSGRIYERNPLLHSGELDYKKACPGSTLHWPVLG
jgi:hypothetical protein